MRAARCLTTPKSGVSSLRYAAIALVLFCIFRIPTCLAQQTPFRSYGPGDGLSDVNPACIKQDFAGYLFACTEHGLFSYDGRRFFNLGPEQGLSDGGVVHDLVFTRNRDVVVRYRSRVYVSRAQPDLAGSPRFLSFRLARSRIGALFDDGPGRMVAWRSGALLLNDGFLAFVDTRVQGSGRDAAPSEIRRIDGLLDWPIDAGKVVSLASDGDAAVWVGTADGRLCRVRTADRVCYGAADGLPATPWLAIVVRSNGHVAARSQTLIADLDPGSRRVATAALPGQGGIYALRPRQLILVEAPNQDLLTQSADGLIVQHDGTWNTLLQANDAPKGPIKTVFFDRAGNLWLGATGHGVERAVGYGLWCNRSAESGLSSDAVWQMSRQPGGPLWVATDGGADALEPEPGSGQGARRPGQVFGGATFAIYADRSGHLWRSDGARGVSRTTIATGQTSYVPMPPVNQILPGKDGRLWLLTQGGVRIIEHADTAPSDPIGLAGLTRSIDDGAVASDGSLWILSAATLQHVRLDGSVETIRTAWPQPDFDPLVLAIADPQTLWIGGAAGGLYRLRIEGGRVAGMQQFEPPEIVSNSIVALLADHRGWLWVGTDLGLSVYNGRRWVSADRSVGLVSNDIDQASLLEDPDGSMWIGTSRGLSHLLHPEALFARSSLHPVIATVHLGDTLLHERAVAFTRAPLTVQFGTLDFKADAVMRFRYKLDGVDSGWADTDTGFARYPSVPFGHHTFQLVAYNPLTHETSAPVSVVIRMRAPWWLWWPLQVAYAAIAAATLYGLLRLRDLYNDHRRDVLQRAVDLRTSELREAQARDSLTGLLTRGEIQYRLMTLLGDPGRTAQPVIGLLDVDHFKAINDRFGHLTGDDILKEIGRRLKAELAPDEFAGRYGGEEILIMLKDGDRQAFARVQELCQAICGRGFVADHELIRVTCSIGATRSRDVDDWKTLIGRADKALYRAKADGRDRMVIADEDALT